MITKRIPMKIRPVDSWCTTQARFKLSHGPEVGWNTVLIRLKLQCINDHLQ